MAVPTTKAELITYCKRKLGEDGSSMIDVNISSTQSEDCVEDALQYYQDYHTDAIQRTYVKYQLTADDVSNGETNGISLTDTGITGVVSVFPVSNTTSNNMFDLNYQMRQNDMWSLISTDLLYYEIIQEKISAIHTMLVGTHTFNFTRHMNKLFIYMDWGTDATENEYLLLEVYKTVDPDIYTEVYNDMWLKRYATALMKRQWGQNLFKFEGIQLPGGLTYSGSALYDQATSEIEALEVEMDSKYQEMPHFLVG